MTETSTAPADGGGNTETASKPGGLSVIGADLSKVGADIIKVAEGLGVVPGLGSTSKSFVVVGEAIQDIGTRLQETASGFSEGKESGGIVGGLLGGASALLGESEGADENGEQSSLDKVREKVSALSKIWNDYYKDLRDKDGNLNTEKLKNLALEVGDTILGAKKMAKVRKVLAVANVIRNNAEAISMAATALPPPFNVPLIAIATALGAKQLGVVQGQTHDGLDKIPSSGTYLLEKGERVVGKRLNQDLSNFLGAASGQGGGGPGAGGSISNFDRSTSNSNFNPTINMTFGGGTSSEAVSSNRGAIETMIREIYADYAQASPFSA